MRLRFRKWPYHEWIGGTILLVVGFFCLFVMNYEMGHLPQTWFQWFMIALLIGGGLGVIIVGKVTQVVLERDLDST